jgi:hypothetical protein
MIFTFFYLFLLFSVHSKIKFLLMTNKNSNATFILGARVPPADVSCVKVYNALHRGKEIIPFFKMSGVLQKTLEEDRNEGVPLTIEPNSAKVNYVNANVFVTAILRRKQKPKRAKKYPKWFKARKFERGFKGCFTSGQHLFEKNKESEAYCLDLVKLLNSRSAIVYAINHRPIKEGKTNTYNGETNDIDGYVDFRAVDAHAYDSDDDSSDHE